MFIPIIGTHLQDNVDHQREGNSMKSTWFSVLKHLNFKESDTSDITGTVDFKIKLLEQLLNDQCISNTDLWDAIVSDKRNHLIGTCRTVKLITLTKAKACFFLHYKEKLKNEMWVWFSVQRGPII
jgi:hypothetical protein